MDRFLQDFVDASFAAATSDELLAQLKKALRRLGIEEFALSEHLGERLIRFVWNEVRGEFASTYRDQGWSRVDPNVRRASRATRAFSWRASAPRQRATRAERTFLRDVSSLGMKAGMVAPFHRPGGRFDIIGFCTSEGAETDVELLRRAHALGLQAWARLNDLTPENPVDAVVLTERERECLEWLKEGKTNWEIGEILDISEKTVEFHVGNLMRKFAADSRLAVVLFALRRGVIEL